MFECEIDRGRSADRASDQCGFVDLEMLKDVHEIGAVGIPKVWHVGFAEAAQIVADDAELTRE